VVTAAEVAELVPELDVEGVAGASFCGEDGNFDRPQSVVEAFAEAVARLGVVVAHEDVRSVEPVGPGWRLRLADGVQVEADRVIVAASVDTPSLLRPLGVDLPIVAEPGGSSLPTRSTSGSSIDSSAPSIDALRPSSSPLGGCSRAISAQPMPRAETRTACGAAFARRLSISSPASSM